MKVWRLPLPGSPFLIPGTAIVVVVALCAVLARSPDWLVRAELAAYDLLLVSMAGEQASPYAALVEVNEHDIQRLGAWPIFDGAIAPTLEAPVQSGPAVVGLDIYRDLPVPPSTSRLEEVLRRDGRIFAVGKMAGADGELGVAGSSVLEGRRRIGFADMATAEDGAVRRVLLSRATRRTRTRLLACS